MKVVFAGHESKGAWILRAKQIAPKLNAVLDPNFTSSKCDLIVLIKIPTPKILEKIICSGVPVIWDIQDCWSQTDKNNMSIWSREQILDYFRILLEKIKPIHVISASSKMKDDIKSLGFNSTVIHHHHRKTIQINPIREKLQVVGIEGSKFQFGDWIGKLDNLVKNLGLQFKVNLETNKDKLSLFDVVINVRAFDGYINTYWKSNIKLANSHGSGTPAICNRQQSYFDTESGQERWADSEEEIASCINELRNYETRLKIHQAFLENKISLEQVIEDYKKLFDNIT